VSILYYVPVLSSYVHDHAALPRISVNADFSTPLRHLASGKKLVEQLCPSTPWKTSALELLVFYYFRRLLVYPCALYFGMLILSHAHGACPTPSPPSHFGHAWKLPFLSRHSFSTGFRPQRIMGGLEL